MSNPGKAIFLSYASQDAGAAKKICEALRAAGVEVWFDQNELRGGDAWDQKIRRQIKECALFVPVISATTKARREGYFRREWKSAVDRTHDMDEALPFLLPVVIDATSDAEAFVPEKFREVQWTRLPGGETPPFFCERVKALLAGTTTGTGRPRPVQRGEGAASPKKAVPLIPVLGLMAVAVVVVFVWQPWRKSAATSPSAVNPAAGATLSEARKLAAKADALFDQDENALRESLTLAEQYSKQAIDLDPNDAEVWAIASRVSSNFVWLTHDRSQERRARAAAAANRAVRLAPDSFEARYALAYYLRLDDATYREAESILRKLVEERPTDKRVWRTLGQTLRQATILPGRSRGREEEALECLRRAASVPGGDPVALLHISTTLATLGRLDDAEKAIDESIALRKVAGSTNKVNLLLRFRGDVARAREALANVPVERLREDFGAFLAAQVWWCARESDKGIEVLRALPRDYLEAAFDGPKALLIGQAHRLAGRSQAAQIEWRAAMQIVDGRLATQPNNVRLLIWKSWLLAALGQPAEAGKLFQAIEQLGLSARDSYWAAAIPLELGDREKALSLLSNAVKDPVVVTRAFLRINPSWDALRGDARFETLVTEPKAQETGDRGQETGDGRLKK
jgi:tetratricopeptide (TPR) repeat protein